MIFHVVPGPEWTAAGSGPYAPASLASEGFVHCSADRASALAVANVHYADAPAPLLLLGIDEAGLSAEVRREGKGQAFPHVYGPIEREAVVEVAELRREDGGWVGP
ncbi:DUF952 domain-containing protein [Streptomyces sp. TLI_146]|uniref:DUF952 domain-containing protein n=1 Tax=Streptomyces sp. TLI_146 TaxID=1938858 RepID=UPI000C6FDB55|nr:DUF952 domain-containing protein [Streptomyces sp. TLI_146]PKV84929.1 uncharacterized protein (DUF952 family) [Streptomyces sp. TLI_146]